MTRRRWAVLGSVVGALLVVAGALVGWWRWNASHDPQVRDSDGAMDQASPGPRPARLALPPADDAHRRVRAVPAYLGSRPS